VATDMDRVNKLIKPLTITPSHRRGRHRREPQEKHKNIDEERRRGTPLPWANLYY
jgi:hypothetical protein